VQDRLSQADFSFPNRGNFLFAHHLLVRGLEASSREHAIARLAQIKTPHGRRFSSRVDFNVRDHYDARLT
jgi:hypothetical protein